MFGRAGGRSCEVEAGSPPPSTRRRAPRNQNTTVALTKRVGDVVGADAVRVEPGDDAVDDDHPCVLLFFVVVVVVVRARCGGGGELWRRRSFEGGQPRDAGER